MKGPPATSITVPAHEPFVGDARYDYADAFEVPVRESDARSAEALVREGIEGAPRAVRVVVLAAQRGLLGLRLGPHPSPDHVLGVDDRHVRARRPPSRGVVPAAAGGPRGPPTPSDAPRAHDVRLLRPPGCGPLAWAMVAPLHRRVARYLLQRGAYSPSRP